MATPMTPAAVKGLPAILREWAGNYEEGSFDTEAGLMIEAAEAIESAEARLAALRDDSQPMECEYDKMTATENVLAWLLIEKVGCVDDRTYTPNEAQAIIARALEGVK